MSFENLSFSEIPLNFQADFLEKISTHLKKGESLQIVGIPGSGSSLIAKAISQNPQIQSKYFPISFHFVRLDGKMLLENNPLSLLRLFLSLLSSDEIPSDEIEIFKQIESKTAGICDNRNLVLIIDHIDVLNSNTLAPFYSSLHQLHRMFEPKLKLIAITSEELKTPAKLSNFGFLARVLVQNILPVPRFNKTDTFWFIGEKEKQTGLILSQKEKDEIFKLSGGFPRTIKRLVEAVGKGLSIAEVSENPLIDPSLAHHLADLENYKDVEIPLFDIYKNMITRERAGESIAGIHFSERLTKNEEKVMKALSLSGGVVSREDVIEKIWGTRGIAISDHAYDQIIHRLRNKLQSSTPKVEIETVKGRGHVIRI